MVIAQGYVPQIAMVDAKVIVPEVARGVVAVDVDRVVKVAASTSARTTAHQPAKTNAFMGVEIVV